MHTVAYLITHTHTPQTEFEEWKHEWESQNCSSLVRATGTKTLLDSKAVYFYCNRTGSYRCESSGQRNSKSQETSKLNAHCTAGLTLLKQRDAFRVTVHKTHYGHSLSLGKLRLSKRVRMTIAGQLAQGVTFEKILEFQRVHLITKKDLTNIERSFSLRSRERHAIDAISVKAWVDDMTLKGSDSPVLLYKVQGCVTSEVGHATGLTLNDFALVIQTPLQAEIMKSCTHNNIVCVDATHGTNTYDFLLISVLAVDEFGEGYPIGWCLSNREDQPLMFNFFNALKQNAGIVLPKWFMSDDAEQYYTSWVSVFGGQPHKLLCTWHVDRAWRKAISNHILNKQDQVAIYHNVRVLLEEPNIANFDALMQSTLSHWKTQPEATNFQHYFQQHYDSRAKQWARYRKQSRINTNMYAEAFHRVLKYVYLKGTVNKRMDHCIHVLLKYSRDKAFERLAKLEKGKTTSRIKTRNFPNNGLSFPQKERELQREFGLPNPHLRKNKPSSYFLPLHIHIH